ncbi:hypothetical protein [Campylobacter sp. JMF_08 NE1]|nr:hypothetical protein [Campylobacter sp. JMF_08 NE1]MDA3048631.1 hypothetical protein [Campylobacter sp. JMF_08 NE1]
MLRCFAPRNDNGERIEASIPRLRSVMIMVSVSAQYLRLAERNDNGSVQ